ncbi:MAG: ORF6N domain-containing protein [Luteolibacter sp.]
MLIPEKIAPLVRVLRHEKVIMDSDLEEQYGVTTKVLNQAVQRNLDRFPPDFMFQVTEDELNALKSQIATSKNAEGFSLRSQFVTLKSGRGQHRKYLPYVFTEQGVAMLSSVLRSPRAVEVNIAIMRTFVQLRRLMDSNALLAEKIEALEAKYAEHDQNFEVVFEAIRQLIATPTPPAREIGFHTHRAQGTQA